MTQRPIWLDGEIARGDRALFGPEDRAFLLGHAAFETLQCRDGVLRRWTRHQDRLLAGLAYLGIPAPARLADLPAGAADLARAVDSGDAIARVTVSAGAGGRGLEAGPGAAPRLLLTLAPRPAPPDAVSVALIPGPRRAGSPGERFKLSGYADLIAARREARAVGAERAVVTGPGGALACADCANLFWITGDQVFTPALDAGALPGVTRAVVLQAAAAAGIDIVEVRAGVDALAYAQAAFMTNAAEGVVAVTSVNGAELAPAHPMIRRIRELERAAL